MSKIIEYIKILTSLLLLLVNLQLKAAKPDAPYNLRCFDKANPVGVTANPYFGWFNSDPDENEIQSAYQIIISSSIEKSDSDIGDIWNSEKVNSRQQNYIYYNGDNLHPATQYFWKVRTWDKDGNVSQYSETANFSIGLLSNIDWSGAKWIKRNTNDKDDYTYFRRSITLPQKTVKRAIVYITACHNYELYINGNIVGKGFNHHYPQYSYYQAWDITSFLNSNSENLFACLTHWYSGGQGRAKGARGLIMKAIIEYTDSTSTSFVTDKTWKQTQAVQWNANQPQRNGEGVGRIEMLDSRKMIKNWNKISYIDKDWGFAKEIGPQPTSPWTKTLRPDLTRVIEEEIKPKSIKRLSNGKYIIDLGKIYAGSFKITFKGGFSGDTIKMLGGFVLDNDNTVSKEINQDTKLDFFFVHNGDSAVFNPHVYFGLRYLLVENSPCVLNSGNVSFIKRHYDLSKENAFFESSNPMLNDVWSLMVHSLIVGAQEGFVDTPTREKGAFLGDSWSQAVPCLSVFYDRSMNLKSLKEFLESQDQYWPDGQLNAVYPNVDGARDIPDYTMVYLIWVWDYYMQTGNYEFLKSNYSRLKKIADYVYSYKNETTGLIQDLKGGKGPYEFGIIDWPMDMRYGYDMNAQSRTVIDAYAYADFNIMANIAEVLGEKSDKDFYYAKANQIKKDINKYLLNKDGVYIDGIYSDFSQSSHVSQHSNIIPYALGIAPAKYHPQIINEIKNRKMNVGMVCLRWLPDAIGIANEGGHLLDLYTNTSWDGWAKTITQGATVTWESWNAIENNESLSHPWGAVGLLGIQNYILGVRPLSPSLDTIQIKPLDFGDKLSYVKGVYKTDKGDVFVHWEKSNGKFILNVKIPVNITADVYIPKPNDDNGFVLFDKNEVKGISSGDYICLKNVGSGEHTFKN
jgi:alpha-L-rhamnosidase